MSAHQVDGIGLFGGLVVGFIKPGEAESERIKEAQSRQDSKEDARGEDSEPEEKAEQGNETSLR
jgi:hypothetical protein